MDANDPEIAHIAGRLASKSSDLNDQRWGLSLLSESFQKLPRDPNVAFHLGWAQYIQGRTNEAQTSMKSVLANGANLPIAASAKHFLDFLPLTEPARASSHVAQIDQALKSDPDYLPALIARAAAAQQSGDSALALKTLEHAIARYPGFGPAFRSAAILSAGRPGDTSKAITFATRARDLYRDDPEVLKALGMIQYQRGEFQNAANTLSSAAQKRSEDEMVQYYLGMSYYKLKQTQQSKTALQKALTLKPQAPFAADAQRILKELK
jgi:Flp pilus assembly protein TadD